MAKRENDLVDWIARRFPPVGKGVRIGIGDDMAMVATGDTGILITSDMLMDGVHFETASHSPEHIGRKALAASLSDCAAMAVRPRYAVISVALPDAWTMEQARRLFLGMEDLAAAHGCAIVGGDTNSWSRGLVIDVAVVAEPYPDTPPVRRSGARPGDALCVTGRLGGSRRGHHLTFQPRVGEARALAVRFGTALHAMMDLSDGLSTDAPRMAAASGCGIVLEEAVLDRVASEAARIAADEDGRSCVDHVLNDGEDFELFFAVTEEALSAVVRAGTHPTETDDAAPGEWTRVGTAVEQPGVRLRGRDGAERRLESRGWQHFT